MAHRAKFSDARCTGGGGRGGGGEGVGSGGGGGGGVTGKRMKRSVKKDPLTASAKGRRLN